MRGGVVRHLSLPGIQGASHICAWARMSTSEYDVTWRLAGTTTHLMMRHLPLTLAGPTGGAHAHSDEHAHRVGREVSRTLHPCRAQLFLTAFTRSACILTAHLI